MFKPLIINGQVFHSDVNNSVLLHWKHLKLFTECSSVTYHGFINSIPTLLHFFFCCLPRIDSHLLYLWCIQHLQCKETTWIYLNFKLPCLLIINKYMDLYDINNSCSAWSEITNIVIWSRKCRERRQNPDGLRIQKKYFQQYIQNNFRKEKLHFLFLHLRS